MSENIKIKLNIIKNNLVRIDIINMDTNFTEKIMEQRIQIHNLKYKLSINFIDKMDNIIKTKFIPTYPKSKTEKIIYIDFNFDDAEFTINDLEQNNLYQIRVELIENYKNEYLPISEICHKVSNLILVNPINGEIDQKKVEQLYALKYKKKIFCNSEKDAIKVVNNEIEYQELGNILNHKEIKNFTMENRVFENINKFTNSNNKFSKKMTEERKKKILYTANSQIYFEEKMIKNGVNVNQFLNNKWFMGPIYSYDNNYKNYI